MQHKSVLGLLTTLSVVAIATDAAAFPLDIDSGDAYPTEIFITSPVGPTVSQFFFNSSFALTLSDSNFLIDASLNNDGTLNTWSSMTITGNLDTGATISGFHILASLEPQTSGNNLFLDAFAGEADVTVSLKINFTGSWKGGTETCRTGAFTASMKSSGNSMPYTLLTGTNYTFTSGLFQSVSNGFNIPAIGGTTCTSAHKTALLNLLSVGGVSSSSAMSIDFGHPVYAFDGLKVHGS